MLANSMSVNTSNVKKNPFNAKPAANIFKKQPQNHLYDHFLGVFWVLFRRYNKQIDNYKLTICRKYQKT